MGVQCRIKIKQNAIVLSHNSKYPYTGSIPVSVHDANARDVKLTGDAVFLSEGLPVRLPNIAQG